MKGRRTCLLGRHRARWMVTGQAMTELALVLPMLALLLLGALDLGRAYHTQVAISNAARVGLIYAQQVATPRMLDCQPGTTCRFLTVQNIIDAVKQEAQGGVDPSQMQVHICLQYVTSCPVTDPTVDISSEEAITVSVTVPFTNIMPFVHLNSISGAVSGETFPFEPVAITATPTAGAPTATATPTATSTPANTATPTATNTPTATFAPLPANTPTATNTTAPGVNTPTPQSTSTPTRTPTSTLTTVPTTTPILPTSTPTPFAPQILTGPFISSNTPGNLITVSWTTNQNTGNGVYLFKNGQLYAAAAGSTPSISFTSQGGVACASAYCQLPKNATYYFYIESTATGYPTAVFSPASGSSCTTDCWSFYLK